MPIYEYECKNCSNRFEKLQPIAADPIKICPTCGAEQVRRIIQPVGVIFKGSGWYITDTRKPESSEGSSSKSSSASKSSDNKPAESSSEKASAASSESTSSSSSSSSSSSADNGSSSSSTDKGSSSSGTSSSS